MYNKEYYKKLDKVVLNAWTNFGHSAVAVLFGTCWYVAMQPVRLYEYLYWEHQEHVREEKERDERFKNMKKYGHI